MVGWIGTWVVTGILVIRNKLMHDSGYNASAL